MYAYDYMYDYYPAPLTGELCPRTRFSLAEILVLAGTTGAGRMAPPASTRISARMKHVLGHSSPVNVQVSRLSLGEDTRIGVIKCQVPRES